jgi:hypothetical protein
MRFMRIAVPTILALIALGISATAAEAKIGPFWKVCEKRAGGKFKDSKCSEVGAPEEFEALRLGKNGKAEIIAEIGQKFMIENKALAITCTKAKVERGAIINGSSGNNFGFGEQVMELEECSVTGGEDTGCKTVSEKTPGTPELGVLRTMPLSFKLGYPEEKLVEGEEILALFAPKSGNVFAKVKFTGKGCTLAEKTIEGSVLGEIWQNGKPIGLGKEVFTAANEVNFPATPIGFTFLEKEGVKTKTEAVLTFGGSVVFRGGEALELQSKEAWGVFNE